MKGWFETERIVRRVLERNATIASVVPCAEHAGHAYVYLERDSRVPLVLLQHLADALSADLFVDFDDSVPEGQLKLTLVDR